MMRIDSERHVTRGPMQFIQFGMLGALGALAIPIIIHLMFRSRARPVDLGTLQFLKVVLRDNARRRKLRRWLLLALRMASLALIALLFARPYMLATEPATGERLIVRSARPLGQHGTGRRNSPDRSSADARHGRSWVGPARAHNSRSRTFGETVQPLADPTDLDKPRSSRHPSGTDY